MNACVAIGIPYKRVLLLFLAKWTSNGWHQAMRSSHGKRVEKTAVEAGGGAQKGKDGCQVSFESECFCCCRFKKKDRRLAERNEDVKKRKKTDTRGRNAEEAEWRIENRM